MSDSDNIYVIKATLGVVLAGLGIFLVHSGLNLMSLTAKKTSIDDVF
jgi:hypothetical protein